MALVSVSAITSLKYQEHPDNVRRKRTKKRRFTPSRISLPYLPFIIPSNDYECLALPPRRQLLDEAMIGSSSTDHCERWPVCTAEVFHRKPQLAPWDGKIWMDFFFFGIQTLVTLSRV